jgi:hypothetical protein
MPSGLPHARALIKAPRLTGLMSIHSGEPGRSFEGERILAWKEASHHRAINGPDRVVGQGPGGHQVGTHGGRGGLPTGDDTMIASSSLHWTAN